MTQPSSLSHARRLGLRALGAAFFVLGAAGIVLPLLPTVVFWILAAWCWTESAPEWRRRLTTHPRYGAPIEQFLHRGTVPRRAKGYAVAAIAVSGALSSLALADRPAVLALLWSILVIVAAWIATRPEPAREGPAVPAASLRD